ncbi:MAG: VanZ family protein [Oscillospiraceae bacterium]|nr:VanZ family protein [Oscillospiraceae bacterium]
MLKKYWHLLFPVLMLALMVFIFCMSAQPADDSSLSSRHFTTFAARHLLTNFREFDALTQEQIIEGLSFIIRKTAHFTEYAMLGFLGYLWLHRIRAGGLIAMGAAVCYAVTDEIHQNFIPGRSCELRDVLVDSSGALCGVIAAFALLSVLHCLTHKDVQQWGKWS